MLLWKSREEPETRGAEYPCAAFRWVLDVGWGYAGLFHQYQLRDTGEWRSSHTTLYMACITQHFAIGQHHAYYDGPHCSFSLGWLHFNWGSWKCKRCLP